MRKRILGETEFARKACHEREAGNGDVQSRQAGDEGESRRLSGHAINSRDGFLTVVDIVNSIVPVLCNQTHAQGKPPDRPVSIVAMVRARHQSIRRTS